MSLFFLYSVIALPLWAAQFALYFWLRRAGKMRESLVAKCAGSFLAVGSAALSLYAHPQLGRPWALFFFLLCAMADAMLEVQFVVGMLEFGAAHVCLILWLWGLAQPAWWSLAIWVGVYLATALLFRKELPTLGKLTAPFLLYPALLGGSLALGLPLPFLLGWQWWPLAAGTLLFYVSDMLVAKNQLSHWPDKWQKPIMALYWAALYLISAGVWVAAIA